MYNIEFTKTAEKQFYKLDKQVQKRIAASLERSRIRPFSHVKRVVGSTNYRLRVGEYRIIAEIKEEKLIILVIKVGHRKNIYK